MDAWEAVKSSNDDHLLQKVEKAVEIIDRTFDLYGYVCMRVLRLFGRMMVWHGRVCLPTVDSCTVPMISLSFFVMQS